jgi:CheY-like chemotaxis protein
MSHEIRTPMNGIIGYADLLKKGKFGSEKQQKFIEIIHNSSTRLMRIISDILDISKIEAGQMKLQTGEVVLNKLFDNLYMFYENNMYLKEKNLKLIMTKGSTDKDYTIIADAFRIEQIIIYLIDNAIKFTSKGSIEFGYLKNNDTVEIYVKDTGIGIPIDKQEIIFERFRQVQETIGRQFGGNGLGLSISKGLAKLMGGTISVQSAENVGTTFNVSIPCKQEKHKIMRTYKPTTVSLKNKVILLVEDDSSSSELIEEVLRPTEVKIIHTKSGLKAVEICATDPTIDLVIMDIRLPDLNGMEATKRIKAARPKLPVIAQTANAMAEDKRGCRDAGCTDYMSKPINAGYLIELLKKYML